MLKRLAFGLLFAIAGFIVAAIAGYFLILALSSNMHDRSVEASMTSVFFFGPIGALIAFAGGVIFGGRRRSKPNDPS